MNIDELQAKIAEICTALNNAKLDSIARTKLENELEEVCINYYHLRKCSA